MLAVRAPRGSLLLVGLAALTAALARPAAPTATTPPRSSRLPDIRCAPCASSGPEAGDAQCPLCLAPPPDPCLGGPRIDTSEVIGAASRCGLPEETLRLPSDLWLTRALPFWRQPGARDCGSVDLLHDSLARTRRAVRCAAAAAASREPFVVTFRANADDSSAETAILGRRDGGRYHTFQLTHARSRTVELGPDAAECASLDTHDRWLVCARPVSRAWLEPQE